MTLELTRHQFNVDDYDRMAATGVLGDDDRVELIEGEILEMSPIGDKHIGCVRRCNYIFSRILGDRVVIDVQSSARINDRSQPQPDLMLLRSVPEMLRDVTPRPEDVLLLIEVADSSLDFDRQVKIPLYARSNIAEFWLVNIPQGVIDVYRDPTPDGYRTVLIARRGDQISPLAFLDAFILVDSILG
jgi:Uma2 family endonuclease